MLDLELLKLRLARWVCSWLGHRAQKGTANVVPIKVLCERCGDPIDLVTR